MDKDTANELIRHIEAYGNLRANVAAFATQYVEASKSTDLVLHDNSDFFLRKARIAHNEAESVMSDILLLINVNTAQYHPPA